MDIGRNTERAACGDACRVALLDWTRAGCCVSVGPSCDGDHGCASGVAGVDDLGAEDQTIGAIAVTTGVFISGQFSGMRATWVGTSAPFTAPVAAPKGMVDPFGRGRRSLPPSACGCSVLP